MQLLGHKGVQFQGGVSFVDHLCYFCLVLLCFHARLFVDPAGKGLISWLSFVMSNCEVVTFPVGVLGQVWCLIVSIPDLCPLSYVYIHLLLLLIKIRQLAVTDLGMFTDIITKISQTLTLPLNIIILS